jgi:hypothetical protein
MDEMPRPLSITPGPAVMRLERLYVRQGQATRVVRLIERILSALSSRSAEAPFQSWLARQYGEDGGCEIAVLSIWQSLDHMLSTLDGRDAASRPAGIEQYRALIEGWTLATYEILRESEHDETGGEAFGPR